MKPRRETAGAFFLQKGLSENPAARAENEDELCDPIVLKLIYLPELISYIVFGDYESSALSLMLSLQKPPVVPCRRFFVLGDCKALSSEADAGSRQESRGRPDSSRASCGRASSAGRRDGCGLHNRTGLRARRISASAATRRCKACPIAPGTPASPIVPAPATACRARNDARPF